MLCVPFQFHEFTVIDTNAGTRPAANFGVTVTPANNSYGSYATVIAGASVTDDVVGMLINLNSFGSSATATDTIAKVGLDVNGGTTFSSDERIVDLLCGAASPYFPTSPGLGGVWYFFPLWIRSGTSIGVCASQNNASPVAGKCFMQLLTRPRAPHLWRCGQKVVSYGTTPASSTGTAVTTGTTSEGTYTQLGTIAAGDRPWWWQLGCGVNNNNVSTSVLHHADLGIGQAGAKKDIIVNQCWSLNTTELASLDLAPSGYGDGAPSELIYGRLQSSGSAQTGLSMAAYGCI